jgi:hypothetical protein
LKLEEIFFVDRRLPKVYMNTSLLLEHGIIGTIIAFYQISLAISNFKRNRTG